MSMFHLGWFLGPGLGISVDASLISTTSAVC